MKNSRFKYYLILGAVKVILITAFAFSYFKSPSNSPNDELKLGIENLLLKPVELAGKRICLVANQTSQINGVHLLDTLLSLNYNVVKIMAPEHGFRGDHSAGAKVKDGKDPKTGLPVVSLYGSNKKPKPDQLNDIDLIIFDIQDVGARFYTYISTLHYVMEAAAENDKTVMVLDRPNPHGGVVDGPILEPEFKSFVGMHPIPVLHGMTIGEYAKMINGEKWLEHGIECSLQVIPMKNYKHAEHYVLPINPSPNLPNDTAIQLYPSLCFFEGTVVSIGRGTESPFQIVGYPGFEGSYGFTPRTILGKSENPKFKDQLCSGYNLANQYAAQLENKGLNLVWLIEFYKAYPDKSVFFNSFFEKLAGTGKLREQIESGLEQKEIKASWQKGILHFQTLQEPYLIYD